MNPRPSTERIDYQATVIGKGWDSGVEEAGARLEERILFKSLAHLVDFFSARKVVECEETKIWNLHSEDAKDLLEFSLVMRCYKE